MRIEALPARADAEPAPTPAVETAAHALPPRGEAPPLEPAAALAAALDTIARFLREAGRELSFSVDATSGRTVITVRDPATGQLIRQMPSEEMLRIARHLDRHGAALVREQA